jgi:lysophospholipid acyltransferase (LPLAT)-like uncharacterized protein
MLGLVVGLAFRCLYCTLRVSITGPRPSHPSLICFWHGQQLCLYGGVPKGNVVAPVSRSKDGDLQVGVLSAFGVDVVRGSSSSGGFNVLRGLIRRIRSDYVVLMALDGPRGPIGEPKVGAFYLAHKLNVPIVPVTVKCEWSYVLQRTWDKMRVPMPFARLRIRFGEAMEPRAFQRPELMRLSFIVAIRELSSDNEM